MSDYRVEAASKEEWAERALRAEAKLAKAVEALQRISLGSQNSMTTKYALGREVRDTLAELKGQDDA